MQPTSTKKASFYEKDEPLMIHVIRTGFTDPMRSYIKVIEQPFYPELEAHFATKEVLEKELNLEDLDKALSQYEWKRYPEEMPPDDTKAWIAVRDLNDRVQYTSDRFTVDRGWWVTEAMPGIKVLGWMEIKSIPEAW